MKPRLTILITSYNKEKYISYVINMLIAQNCEDIVVHIIDDGSTDNSLNIINELISDVDNFHLHHWDKNKGTGKTRNYALDLVETNYFIFIDADDMITENYVTKILEYITEDPTADIHYFRTRIYPLGATVCYDFSLWDRVISKEFLDKNNIRFKDSLTNMEDYNLRRKIEKIDFTEVSHSDVLYIYNLLAEGTVTHENPIWYGHNLEGIREECDPNTIAIYNDTED